MTGAKDSGVPHAAESEAHAGLPRIWDEEPEATRTAVTGARAPEPPARPTRRAALVVITGRSAGRILLIESAKMTVGRSRKANLTLSDEGVSRMHCGMDCDGTSCFATDLGSTHGTLVNGERVERVELRPGDRIQVGPEVLLQYDVYDDAEEGLANKLYEGATRDLLTRALNRRAFQERLAAEVAYATRHRSKLAAVAVSIDDLSGVVGVHGQAAVDAALREVALAMGSTLRVEDALARVGPTSFVVLGRGLSLRKGVKLAERMRKLVADRVVTLDQLCLRLTVSAGVAELGEAEHPAAGEDLVRIADRRLSTVIETGSSGVCFRD